MCGRASAGETIPEEGAEASQFLNLTDEELSGLSEAMSIAENMLDSSTLQFESVADTEEDAESLDDASLLFPVETAAAPPQITRVDEVQFLLRQLRFRLPGRSGD